jgi:N-acetyl-anhydromuramyl-L-alanine amidase AmpD
LDAETADAVRAVAAQARARADQFAAALEDIATNGLPDPEQCIPWEDLREQHLARLAKQRPAVA